MPLPPCLDQAHAEAEARYPAETDAALADMTRRIRRARPISPHPTA